MDELQQQLDKAQEKRRNAKRRCTIFKKDVQQIVYLESKISYVYARLKEKKAKWNSVLRVRVLVQAQVKSVGKELAEVKTATRHYEEYSRQLGKELSAAETTVSEAKTAISEYRNNGIKLELNVTKSHEDVVFEALRRIPEDFSRIEKDGWKSIFPALWTCCG